MASNKEFVASILTKDSKKQDRLLVKFVNCLMKCGKKSVAIKLVNEALAIVEEKTGKPAMEVFEKVIDNVSPSVEVKSRRVGGSTYQVPTEIKSKRQLSLAFRWLITYSLQRSEKGMIKKLSSEFIDAFHERGGAFKKKEDTHKMAEANKAFAHFKW